MRRFFLSYHSADEAVAAQLVAAIERKDSTSRVFFAPTRLRAGGSWTAQLAQQISDADAFILLIGKRVGPWQVLEYDEALDKWAKAPSSFPLVVVLLEGHTAPGLPFLRRLHWIITPDRAWANPRWRRRACSQLSNAKPGQRRRVRRADGRQHLGTAGNGAFCRSSPA